MNLSCHRRVDTESLQMRHPGSPGASIESGAVPDLQPENPRHSTQVPRGRMKFRICTRFIESRSGKDHAMHQICAKARRVARSKTMMMGHDAVRANGHFGSAGADPAHNRTRRVLPPQRAGSCDHVEARVRRSAATTSSFPCPACSRGRRSCPAGIRNTALRTGRCRDWN